MTDSFAVLPLPSISGDDNSAGAVVPNDGAMWFGANAHGDPSDAQLIEHIEAVRTRGTELRCTHKIIPQVVETHEVVLSRPFWRWGATMGANGRGVAIAVHDVVTRALPGRATRDGLLGCDLVRLALERAHSARDAVHVITQLMHVHGVVARRGIGALRPRAHPSFLIADAREGWLLETAGPHWAAKRVQGTGVHSDMLTIGLDADLLSSDAYSFARAERRCTGTSDFHFGRAFGDPLAPALSGARARRAASSRVLASARGRIHFATAAAALRDHGGREPAEGMTRSMMCAHASYWPTRLRGQTTGSLIVRSDVHGVRCWATGTSSPCLGVLKPIVLGAPSTLDPGPRPHGRYDAHSLYWQHELVHRHVLVAPRARFDNVAAACAQLERHFTTPDGELVAGTSWQRAWDDHRAILDEWAHPVLSMRAARDSRFLFARFWRLESVRDRVPTRIVARS